VTAQEVVDYLEELKAELLREGAEHGVCGDMRPLLLQWAIDRLRESEE
jgi:hypothetical protein